jgi:hypothetical protein
MFSLLSRRDASPDAMPDGSTYALLPEYGSRWEGMRLSMQSVLEGTEVPTGH